MPFIASSEFFRMLVKRGAAIVQIAVTNPVVIRTTRTHPGTSPRSDVSPEDMRLEIIFTFLLL